ncbi:hypothetical protein ABTZ59_36110 [Streptomyces sp. NPDC094034]|uniref:hypothetical protein n=1 Tax=Streptomyces sp. NPDC094034 TaxID=3155309 RepID=UPI00332FEBE9
MASDFHQPGRALHPFRPVREPGQVHYDDKFFAVRADPGFLADQARRGRVADRAETHGLVPQYLAGLAEREGVRSLG